MDGIKVTLGAVVTGASPGSIAIGTDGGVAFVQPMNEVTFVDDWRRADHVEVQLADSIEEAGALVGKHLRVTFEVVD